MFIRVCERVSCMSNRILTQAWNVRGLPATEKLILVNLADRADNTGHCYPSHKRIGDDCGLTGRTVRDTLPKIASKGHLTIIKDTGRTSNGKSRYSYIVHPVTPEAASGVTQEMVASDTGKEAFRQGKTTAPTPEIGASPILTTTNLISNHQENQSRQPPQSISVAQRITLEKELADILVQRKRIENGASHDAWGPMYSPEEKSLLKQMKVREVEIKKLLGRVF